MTLVTAEVARVWHLLDPSRLEETLPAYTNAIQAIVEKYSGMSATIAADYYERARALAGVRGVFTARPSDGPPPAQIEKTVSWATHTMWGAVPEGTTAAPDTPTFTEEDIQTLIEGAIDNLVVNVGRDTIIDNAERDKAAKGWARVPETDCCYFCALLSTRGAVYHSRESASFEAHDHCRCHVEALFGDYYEPTAQVREWDGLYKRSTSGVYGQEKLKAFRRAFEGRSQS